MKDNVKFETSTLFIHLALSAICGWVIKNIPMRKYPYLFILFMFIMLHSVIGILNFSQPNLYKSSNHHKPKAIQNLFNISFYIMRSELPLEFLNYEFYTKYEVNKYILYAIIVSTLITFVFKSLRNNLYVVYILALGNIILLGYLGISIGNYWTVGLTFLSLINYLLVERLVRTYYLVKTELITIGFCFFNIFAVNSLLEMK